MGTILRGNGDLRNTASKHLRHSMLHPRMQAVVRSHYECYLLGCCSSFERGQSRVHGRNFNNDTIVTHLVDPPRPPRPPAEPELLPPVRLPPEPLRPPPPPPLRPPPPPPPLRFSRVTKIGSLGADVSTGPSRSIDWRFMIARGSTAVESRCSRVVVRESFIFVARCQVGIIR